MLSRVMHHFREHWLAWIIAALFVSVLTFASQPPYHENFRQVMLVHRLALLPFGLVLLIYEILYDVTWLMIFPAFLVLGICVLLVVRLWREKQWGTVIPIAVLIGANSLFVGAFSYVTAPRLSDVIESCTLILDPETTMRIVRHPIDVRAEIGEQQFFLITYDNGESWRQIITVYVLGLLPVDLPCGYHVLREGDESLVLRVQEKSGPNANRTRVYESPDLGRTWYEVTGEDEDPS